MLRDFAAQEDLLFLLPEGQRAQFAHTPFANHLARHVRGPLDVIACSGAHDIQEHLFRDAATHQNRDLRLKVVLVIVVPVIRRQLHGDAQGHAPGNDSDLVQRIGMRHLRGHQRVSSFVIRRVFLFLVGEQQRLALHAH